VVEHDGERIAALVHDATVLDDPGLAGWVAQAAIIALSNARLQAEALRRVGELDASRRRIPAAADAQRRHLRKQLQATAGQHLTGAKDILDFGG
jgi:DMSO/TMAO reductase YedYZ molybdopterin-dependent catalytic subunit